MNIGPLTATALLVLPVSVSYHLVKIWRANRLIDSEPVASESLGAQYRAIVGTPEPEPEPEPIPEPANDKPEPIPEPARDDAVKVEAISALRNLGMTKASATRLAAQVWDATPDDITLPDMIKRCLRALNK